MEGAEKVSRHSTGEISGVSPAEALADRMQLEAAPAIGMMVDQISLMLDRAESLDEFREMLMAGFPKLHAEGLAQAMAMGLMAAELAGRASVGRFGGRSPRRTRVHARAQYGSIATRWRPATRSASASASSRLAAPPFEASGWRNGVSVGAPVHHAAQK